MHTIAFHSPNPLDHVCRALDTVRKMGFQLASLCVEGEADGGFRVCIALEAHDCLNLETLLERLSLCVGVRDVTCDVNNNDATQPVPFRLRAWRQPSSPQV